MRIYLAAATAAFLALGSGSAYSAASEWTTVQGGAVRVVMSADPDENGRLRGALQIDLEPGWKTYWLDPGSSGVPPAVAMSMQGDPGDVEIGFPPPSRYDDGYSVWAGYSRSVSLALTITPPQAAGPMEFSVFLGMCETICIPVQSAFSIRATPNVADPEHEAIVESAFAALPRPAHPGFRVIAARADGESMIVEAEAPADEAADLFLASTENRLFGTPQPEVRDGKVAFRVPILWRAEGASEQTLYTLVSGERAVTGTITVGE